MIKFTFTSDKNESRFGMSWSRSVEIEGVIYRCFVKRGKRVRIPFKPRGENIGFKWYGCVYDINNKRVWSGNVPKSQGCRGLLLKAGLLENSK